MEKTTEQRHAGHVIEQRLKEMNKTPYWLAGKCNVSRNGARLWVRTGKISRKNLPVIAAVLGLSTADLLATEGETPAAAAPMSAAAHFESAALQSHYITAKEFAMIDVYRRSSEVGRSLLDQAIKAAAELIKN